MKKTILIVAAIAFIILFNTQAFACNRDGYWGDPSGEPVMGAYDNAYQWFFDQTAQLRQDLAANRGEYNALMAKSNPDSKWASESNREITVLHDLLSSQARFFNLPSSNSRYYGRMD